MSNSTTNLDAIVAGAMEVVTNFMMDAASPAMLWGRRAAACGALAWGYYGGTYQTPSGTNTIANGTLALTASATNYVQANASTGAVSVNTTGFTAGSVPLYSISTGTLGVNSWADYRSLQPSAIAGGILAMANEGTGVGVVDTVNSTASAIKLKSLVAGAGITITDNGTSITIAAGSGGGTVTGATNEGSGAGVYDATNSTPTTLKFKSLVAGSGVTITDGGSSGITIAAGGTPAAPAVQSGGSAIVSAATALNFTTATVTGSGNTANVALSSGVGAADTPPVLSSLTATLGTGVTATQQSFGVGVALPANSSTDNWTALLMKTVPATPYTLTMRVRAVSMNAGYASPVFSDGTKLVSMGAVFNGNNSITMQITAWNSTTSRNGAPSSMNVATWPEWQRVRDDGTNLYFDISPDGVAWTNVFSYGRTAFLSAPASVGFGCNPYNAPVQFTLFSWAGV